MLPGVVTGLKDFGAFVDLGGIEGMLHVSEIGFSRVTRPADVLAIGQPVTVQVIRIEKRNDPNRPEQVALSLKALAADPWEEAAARFPAGTRVAGTVTRVEPFGAFVELAPGVEGLAHISTLGGGKPLRHARDAVKPGDRLEVTVIAVDRERRRLSLAPAGESEAIDAESRAVADRAEARASSARSRTCSTSSRRRAESSREALKQPADALGICGPLPRPRGRAGERASLASRGARRGRGRRLAQGLPSP